MDVNDITSLYEKIPKDWIEYFDKKDIDNVENFLKDEIEEKTIYPKDIFKFLKYFKPSDTKVIIVGQDPYHNGSALGYSFGVEKSNINVSLKNIFTEIESCFNIEKRDYTLKKWLRQNVLLLNKSLTVEKSVPNSHKETWRSITRKFVERLSRMKNLIFMLWGNNARELSLYIHSGNFIFESSHPSFFSANRGKNSFLGCNHFKLCNEKLKEIDKEEINW